MQPRRGYAHPANESPATTNMLNQLKTAFFLALLSAIVLGVGYLVGGPTGLTIGLILAVIMNFGALFFSHKLVLWIYKAKEAPKNRYPGLHAMVEEVAKSANIPKPKVYIVPSEAPNAFATGPSYKKSVVACTQGILDLLSKDELKGVLAHELAHIKNRDMLISTVAATIASIISYAAFMARFAAFTGDSEENRGGIISLLLIGILAPLAAMLIQLAISRAREYVADETGARLIKNPLSLANALAKLESESKRKPLRLGTESTNHLFIVNPFRGTGRAFINLFTTHPPLESRIQRLKAMKL